MAAFKSECKLNTFLFGLIVGLVFTIILTPLMSLLMTLIGACLLGGAPVVPSLLGAVKTMPIYAAVSFVSGQIIIRPLQNLAAKIAAVH